MPAARAAARRCSRSRSRCPHARLLTTFLSLGCVLTPPEPEQVLTFPLSGLPSTVNQDVKISIALPSGETTLCLGC